jgi:hypothetical protein
MADNPMDSLIKKFEKIYLNLAEQIELLSAKVDK